MADAIYMLVVICSMATHTCEISTPYKTVDPAACAHELEDTLKMLKDKLKDEPDMLITGDCLVPTKGGSRL